MSSASQGFCCCLPARLGVLVISSLACLGSAILAGLSIHSLSNNSKHITAIQTAGFSLVSISWIALALFTLFCFISAILRRPSLLLISSRLIIYHLPVNLLCNVLFIVALLQTYHNLMTLSKSKICASDSTTCARSASLGILAWVHLWILLPVIISQIYLYILIKRFMSIINGGGSPNEEELYEVKKPTQSEAPDDERHDGVTYSVGSRGRRSKLRFTMEKKPTLEPGESFLPSMIFSPTDFQSPIRSPIHPSSPGLPASPRSTVIIGKGVVSSQSPLRPSTPAASPVVISDKAVVSSQSPLRPSTPAASPVVVSNKGENAPPAKSPDIDVAKALPLPPPPEARFPPAQAARQAQQREDRRETAGRTRTSVASMDTSESAHVEEQFSGSISSSKREEMWNRYWG